MGDGAVFTQVAVPPVVGLVQVHLIQAGVEHVKAFLALGAADDLANAGRQHVHRGNGFAVVIHTHIKCLDVFRVIHDHHRSADVFLGEPAFVLALQIHAPLHGELKLMPVDNGLLEARDGVGVIHALEAGLDEFLQPLDAALIDALLEKRHVISALIKQRAEDALQKILRQVGVIGQISKRNLRLDHPKLREMPRGVGVFRAKGRPEGVHLAQR